MSEEEKRFHEKMADRLIEAREAAGMTQEKLAEKVGLQSNSIHRYEAAERKMNFFTAVKMADALDTTVEKLVPEEYIHKTEKTDVEREAEDVFHQLSPEEQKNAPSTDEGAAGSASVNRAVEGLLCGFYFVIGGPPCQLFLNFYQVVELETYLQQSG